MKPAAVRLIPLVAAVIATAPVPCFATVHFDWNIRARHESVDDEAFANSASAQTLRLRAALRRGAATGWNWLLEAEGIASAGNYNSGSNGRTDLPAIADPPGLELNQAWAGWKGKRASATVGRQRISWDNQRWIGNVGWRQNEQTFDALQLESKPRHDVTVKYAWLGKVHRIAGDEARDPLARERDLDSHLFNLGYTRGRQQWTGYAYLHQDRDVASASSSTLGLRWSGAVAGRWGWTVEAARQGDYADNPRSFSHSYWLLEPSLKCGLVTWKLGWEHLGGDGQHALQTPLATLHAFNGWADKFLVTPPAGLEDAYLVATGKLSGLDWNVGVHDYRADYGDLHYGREFDASLARVLRPGLSAMLKLADYRSDGLARDTRKLWLQLEYSGSLPR